MLKLAALVGPTGVGKTQISIDLAKRLGGEIISCDSMQVYRGMDIGTAKADIKERKGIAHYLLDLVEPKAVFTVADYQKLAQEKIKTINQRGKIPLLVGGTGLYYQSVVDNFDFFPMEAKEAVRRKWEQVYSERGMQYIYEKALEIDKEYALKIGPHDKKRIIRSLEVYDLTGQAFSAIQTRNKNTYLLAAVGLYLERSQLYARIDERVDQMIADGLVEEVAGLRERGCDLSLNSMQALGYKQIYSYLEGMLSWEETLRDIKRETRHFAKRQYTWFNKDKRISWINVAEYANKSILLEKICDLMEGQLFGM
jgi:tRNA dimethylallyltransferase